MVLTIISVTTSIKAFNVLEFETTCIIIALTAITYLYLISLLAISNPILEPSTHNKQGTSKHTNPQPKPTFQLNSSTQARNQGT